MDVTVSVNDAGFAVLFSEPVTVTEGSLSGTWNGASFSIDTEFASGVFWALEGTHHDKGRGSIRMDEIEINSGFVPEPATLALLGLGGLGMLIRRKR